MGLVVLTSNWSSCESSHSCHDGEKAKAIGEESETLNVHDEEGHQGHHGACHTTDTPHHPIMYHPAGSLQWLKQFDL